MAAATHDLYIEQGTTFRLKMTYAHKVFDSQGNATLDVDGNVIMQPYDLSGCRARMQIRQRYESEVLIAATTTNGGILIPVGTDGVLQIVVTDEATDSLQIKKAIYDLEISYPSGDVKRILQGKVAISPNVTRGAEVDNIASGVGDVHAIDEQDLSLDANVLQQPSTFETH